MTPGFFPILPLAEKVVALVLRGRHEQAETELINAGYSDAAQQVKDLAGFIKLMKENYGSAKLHRYK